jgi:hypothetical protein
MNSLLTVKHYIHNYTKTRQEETLHVIVSSCVEYLAVEEEIFHGKSMTSVINISIYIDLYILLSQRFKNVARASCVGPCAVFFARIYRVHV